VADCGLVPRLPTRPAPLPVCAEILLLDPRGRLTTQMASVATAIALFWPLGQLPDPKWLYEDPARRSGPAVECAQVLNTRSVPLSVLQRMLATSGPPGRDFSAWSFETKWDGWSALVYVDGGLRIRTGTGRQVSDSLPELMGLVDAVDGHSVTLDGELVACPGGVVNFYALAPRMLHTGRMARFAATQTPVTFVACDLVHLDGQDLTGLPLLERKGPLDELHLVGAALGDQRLVPRRRRHPLPGLFRAWPRTRGGQAPGRPLPPGYSVANLAQAELLGLDKGSRPSPTTSIPAKPP
jgi:hypothetical protein